MTKLTMSQARRQIAQLEAEVKVWRERCEAPEHEVEAARWDEHHVRAVFELCALAGERPRSNAPEDIAEAAESIAFKYRRR